MPLVVLRFSTLRKISTIAACVLACTCFQTPTALAQRVGHIGGGGHLGTGGRIGAPHVAAPHVGAPHIAAPPAPASRAIFLHPRVGFPERPPLIFRRPFFIRTPFFRSWERFDSSWWLNCGPIWGWNYGCGDFFVPEYAFEHYPAPPLTYNTPVYVYSLDGHQLVQLYLKDGSVYNVNDYWFVNNQIHFTMLDENGMKSLEQVISFEDLDLQKTIDVNTRRGFRVVMRSQPIEQYLRDHPDLTPPLLQRAQKN
jgi:hypothetical protein